jgi:hypothetical protein
LLCFLRAETDTELQFELMLELLELAQRPVRLLDIAVRHFEILLFVSQVRALFE